MERGYMRVLLIDNYDSFTYNLVQYLGELGAEVEVRRNDEVTVGEVQEEIRPDRVVVSPGPGTPNEAGVTLEMIGALAGHVPVLGVCLGHQAIGQIFEGLEYRFPAARYHSLVVERESLPDCLEVSATTPDGVIMGLRHRRLKVEGVQFHPESILTTEGKRLLANFLKH